MKRTNKYSFEGYERTKTQDNIFSLEVIADLTYLIFTSLQIYNCRMNASYIITDELPQLDFNFEMDLNWQNIFLIKQTCDILDMCLCIFFSCLVFGNILQICMNVYVLLMKQKARYLLWSLYFYEIYANFISKYMKIFGKACQ